MYNKEFNMPKKYLDFNINNIEYASGIKNTGNIDSVSINNLSSYVTGKDMNDISGSLYEAVSALNNLYLPSDTSDLTGNTAGYITSSVAELTNFYDKSYIDNNYWTGSYINNNYWTRSYITGNFYDKLYIDSNYWTSSYISSNYWTSTQTDTIIDEKLNIKISGGFNFKGSIDSYSDLEAKTSISNVGDVWHVVEEDPVDHSINNEYILTGNNNDNKVWVKLGPDLSNYYPKNTFDKYFIFTDDNCLSTYLPVESSGTFVVREDSKLIYPTTENNNFHQSEPILYLDAIKEIPTSYIHRHDIPYNKTSPEVLTGTGEEYTYPNNFTDTTYDFGSIYFRGQYNGKWVPRLTIDCDESIITGSVLDLLGNIAANPEDLREIRTEFHIGDISGKNITGVAHSTNSNITAPVFRICARMRNTRR